MRNFYAFIDEIGNIVSTLNTKGNHDDDVRSKRMTADEFVKSETLMYDIAKLKFIKKPEPPKEKVATINTLMDKLKELETKIEGLKT